MSNEPRRALGTLWRLFFFRAEEWSAAFRDPTIRRLVYLCLAVGLASALYGAASGMGAGLSWMPVLLAASVVGLGLTILRWGIRAVAVAAPALSFAVAYAICASTFAVLFSFPRPLYLDGPVLPRQMSNFVQWAPVFFVLNAMWFRPMGARVVNLLTAAGVLGPSAVWLASSPLVRLGGIDTNAVALNFFVLAAGLLAQEFAFAAREQRAMRLSAARQSLLDLRRKRAVERELRGARADIARLNRVSITNAMASTIAHEVKQPLAAAVNFSGAARNWMTRSPPEIGRAWKALEGLEIELIRARDVIEEIRAMTARDEPAPVAVDMMAMLEQALVLIRREAETKGVRLEVQVAPTLPRVAGRPVQLQQVLLNLASNAFEAFDGARPPVLRLSADAEIDGVRIVVADNGPGIPAAHMASVQRGLFTTKTGGSGLGLTICRQIIESHGGVFELDSTDAGLTAIVRLPVSTATGPGGL